MKRWMVVLGGIVVLILPFIGMGVARCFFAKNIFDNPDFWYGYMAYFGTVLLATVALFQNVGADEVNNRLMRQQLRQKVGYFELKKVHEQKIVLDSNHEIIQMNGYQEVKVEKVTDCLGRSDISTRPVVKICLKNVGEDVILNLDILNAKINEKEIIVPCSNKVVYKEEEIWFELEYIQPTHLTNLNIDLVFQIENMAGIRYRQNIFIEAQKFSIYENSNIDQMKAVEDNDKSADIYMVTGFGSSIDFFE